MSVSKTSLLTFTHRRWGHWHHLVWGQSPALVLSQDGSSSCWAETLKMGFSPPRASSTRGDLQGGAAGWLEHALYGIYKLTTQMYI